MRTWLVLAAVLAVGAAAVADALHGGLAGDARPAAETALRRIVPPGVPEGFMGSVFFSDPSDACRLHTLQLAGFTDAVAPASRECRFSLSPDGTRTAPAGSAWSPLGGVVAVPGAGVFVLRSASGQTVEVRGSAPGFKPDGTLTYLRAGELVEWSIRCSPRERLFTLPGDNATARCVRVVYPHPLTSVAWLSDSRFAAISRAGDAVLVEGGTVLIRAHLPRHRTARLTVSPERSFVSIWLDGELAGTFDARGAPVEMPPVAHVRALAWSPTERWAMLATGDDSVYIFRPNTAEARLRRLDITARDLAWR
jgi:hypothetical protein